MTDRLKGVVVLFEKDTRKDDAEALISAIRCLKNVAAVNPNLSTPDDWMNRERVRLELHKELFQVLYRDKEQ